PDAAAVDEAAFFASSASFFALALSRALISLGVICALSSASQSRTSYAMLRSLSAGSAYSGGPWIVVTRWSPQDSTSGARSFAVTCASSSGYQVKKSLSRPSETRTSARRLSICVVDVSLGLDNDFFT